jgi:hypothetical protein
MHLNGLAREKLCVELTEASAVYDQWVAAGYAVNVCCCNSPLRILTGACKSVQWRPRINVGRMYLCIVLRYARRWSDFESRSAPLIM